MKRKLLCIIVVSALLFSACASNTEQTETAENTAQQESETSSLDDDAEPNAAVNNDDASQPEELESESENIESEPEEKELEFIDFSMLDENADSRDIPAQNVSLFKLNYPAPNFSVTDRQNNTISLSDYSGKTLVINFWASWCPPCREEMPDIDKLDKEWKESGDVAFLAINLTDGFRETETEAKDFIDEQGYSFDIAFDRGEAANSYMISSIPATYVIKPDGTLYSMVIGMTDENVLRALVEKAS